MMFEDMTRIRGSELLNLELKMIDLYNCSFEMVPKINLIQSGSCVQVRAKGELLFI